MDIQEREKLLRDLAEGHVTLRDFAQLKRRDVDAIAHLGRVAFESKKFEQAASIFHFLETLEADRPDYAMFVAECYAAASKKKEAIEALDRYVGRQEYIPATDLVKAFVLRAQLLAENDRVGAAHSLRAAKMVAERSPDAMKMLEEAGL